MKKIESIFITVGTTDFDDLLRAIDNSQFIDVISSVGCRNLTVQMGRGSYTPLYLEEECSRRGISYYLFRFQPTLDDHMKAADLIISHCGAGSILEALSLEKLLIAVVNTSLQGNHQEELSDALAAQHYCLSSDPSRIVASLESLLHSPSDSLKVFPPADLDLFPRAVNELFGFSE